jgi:hypothetical protein
VEPSSAGGGFGSAPRELHPLARRSADSRIRRAFSFPPTPVCVTLRSVKLARASARSMHSPRGKASSAASSRFPTWRRPSCGARNPFTGFCGTISGLRYYNPSTGDDAVRQIDPVCSPWDGTSKRSVVAPAVRPKKIKTYTAEGLKNLLAAAPKKFRPILALAAFAGIRSSEPELLDWKHIRQQVEVLVGQSVQTVVLGRLQRQGSNPRA